jgi:Holliday junction resolvase RusA-like endonuclease
VKRHPITIIVAGVPVTQGSMRARVVAGHAVVRHSNGTKIDMWRSRIVDAVHRQLGEEFQLITGPVRLSASFRLPRTANVPKVKRTWPIGRRSGDTDKYLRCLGDALTGSVIVDDCQIVDASVTKDWTFPGAQPGVVFTVWEVTS